jgi:hypothetical protein
MLGTGKRYRLIAPAAAIDKSIPERLTVVRISAGEVIDIASAPSQMDPSIVEVRWDGKNLTMFVDDIAERAEEVV